MFVLTLFVLIGYGIDVARGECGGGNVFCLTIKSQPSCADGGCEWDSELNLCEDGSGPTRKCNSYETKDECEGVKCLWTGVQPTPPPSPASDDFVGTTRRSTASTNQDSSSEANDWAIWTWIYYPVIFGGACLYYGGAACAKKSQTTSLSKSFSLACSRAQYLFFSSSNRCCADCQQLGQKQRFQI
mmetsp:Transcript_4718/g.7581  ORF Transcript_4718/g.7581 Transcript_4718/m.7581 type:complete len:186 (+) Transcript_4718:35-592(+)